MIDRRNSWEVKRAKVYRKRVLSTYEHRKLDMADFADRLARLDNRQIITVNAIWAHYASSKKSLIRQALEFASNLGVLQRVDEHIYRRSREIPNGKLFILKNTPISSLNTPDTKLKNARKNAIANSIANNSFTFDSDAMRLNMSASVHDGSHGRKKSNEYNDKVALEGSRNRYGLNNKDILEYDLD